MAVSNQLEEGEDVYVTEINPAPVPKKSMITDFFKRCSNSSEPSEFPSCLRSFNPSDVHQSRPRAHTVTMSRRVQNLLKLERGPRK